MAINYDRDIQPPLTTNQSFSNNEMEGKRVRKALTEYFVP